MKQNYLILLTGILFFLSGCYSVNIKDNDPSYTYFQLLKQKDNQKILSYIDDLSSNAKDNLITDTHNPYGLGVIAITVYMHKTSLIENLIKIGADIDQKGLKDITALHIAASIKDAKTLVMLLDTYHAHPSLNNDGQNLLHIAAQKINNPVVKELLNRFPKMVNKQDNLGNTPLMYAIANKDIATVRLLKKAKAQINVKNKEGDTPLTQANDLNDLAILKILGSKK